MGSGVRTLCARGVHHQVGSEEWGPLAPRAVVVELCCRNRGWRLQRKPGEGMAGRRLASGRQPFCGTATSGSLLFPPTPLPRLSRVFFSATAGRPGSRRFSSATPATLVAPFADRCAAESFMSCLVPRGGTRSSWLCALFRWPLCFGDVERAGSSEDNLDSVGCVLYGDS